MSPHVVAAPEPPPGLVSVVDARRLLLRGAVATRARLPQPGVCDAGDALSGDVSAPSAASFLGVTGAAALARDGRGERLDVLLPRLLPLSLLRELKNLPHRAFLGDRSVSAPRSAGRELPVMLLPVPFWRFIIEYHRFLTALSGLQVQPAARRR